jgi:hypothetical protein
MCIYLLVQSITAQFIDPISNASEWTSHMNFVLTALLGLLVALAVPGQTFWNGWALYMQVIFSKMSGGTYSLKECISLHMGSQLVSINPGSVYLG